MTEFWEIGAGKALSGMIRRIAKGAATRAVGTPDDVAALKADAWLPGAPPRTPGIFGDEEKDIACSI